MGLTLNFQLRLPGELSKAAVLGVLGQLRERATTLGFAQVSPIFTVAPGEDFFASLEKPVPFELLFRHMVPCLTRAWETDTRGNAEWTQLATTDVLGFVIDPGDGCDHAIFGFGAAMSHGTADRAETAQPPGDWFWDGFCRTQYASTNGDEHFLRCHLSLVALLDSAIKLGIRVEVSDDGGYWETRSTEHLLAKLRTNNVLMAKIAAKMREALPDPDDLEAPIFDHPDYEALAEHDAILFLEGLESEDDDDDDWVTR